MYQNSRWQLLTAVLLSSAVIFIGGCNSDDVPAHKPLSLTVLHINDSHSHIDSERKSFHLSDGTKVYYQAGGYPRIVTEVKKLRKKYPHTLTLHAGDVFQGTLYYSIFRGEADAAAMAKVGFDAYTLGNHSFDDGDEGLKKFLDWLREDDTNISVLSANVVPDDDNILHGYWKPYTIKMIDGEPVGIIGITVKKKTQESSNPSDEIKFYDETKTAQKMIDELKAKGVNKIILLTHYGYRNDIAMAKKLKGVDVIVGGDSHTYLGNFAPLASSEGPYPTIVKDEDNNTVCIVQAAQYTKVLGELHVDFDAEGEVQSCEGTPHMLIGDQFLVKDSEGNKVPADEAVLEKIYKEINASDVVEVAEDPDTLETISVYKDQIDAKKAETIGHAAEDLRHIRIPGHDYLGNDGSSMPHGSEIAPVVAKAFYEEYKPADACIQNAGGVRINIPAGKISMGEAYELLPFSNTIYAIDMKGSEIKQVLEDALANFADNGGSTGSFPYAYALRYDINMSKGHNRRISHLQIKDRKSGTWSDIDPDKFYTVVTNSYIAGGKDGYATFARVQEERGKGTDTYLDYAMSFVDYVERLEKEGEKVHRLPTEDLCIQHYTEQ